MLSGQKRAMYDAVISLIWKPASEKAYNFQCFFDKLRAEHV